MLRRLCIVTGTRAEYGLLYWLMRDIAHRPDMSLQVIATAMHLEPAFGHTVDQIRDDGFKVDAEVAMDLTRDDAASVARAAGRGLSGLADAFDRLRPDIVVLLGDRFETLAAATAAALLRIPIAHIHGGEISEGAIDDAMRHAITKLSYLHFVAAEEFRTRVIQMGEVPERVFAVGALGPDRLVRSALPDWAAVAERLGINPNRQLFLVTYHPATLDEDDPVAALTELLSALDSFKDAAILFTKANADVGGHAINAKLEAYAAENRDRAVVVASLGSDAYLAAMKRAVAVIGNSSSGIIEAPAAGTPTVNIGIRQQGRPRSGSVIDCIDKRHEIEAAIRRALEPSMREVVAAQVPAYGRAGNASRLICEHLRKARIDGVPRKQFYDVPWLQRPLQFARRP